MNVVRRPHLGFQVYGTPKGKGSMRPIKTKGGKVIMTHPKDSVEFQELCSRAAMRAAERCREEGVDAQLAGPCMVSIVFRLQRPKGHYGTGRNAGILKASSPHVPVTKPDVDKMVRVVLDALTGIAFMDDSQVVELRALKKYADDNPHPPGATCQVYELQFEEEG